MIGYTGEFIVEFKEKEVIESTQGSWPEHPGECSCHLQACRRLGLSSLAGRKFSFANGTEKELSPRSPSRSMGRKMRGSYEKLRYKFGSHQHIDSI